MTTESTTHSRSLPPFDDIGAVPGAEVPLVVDTTELRWFANGPLSPDVTSWFTRNGTTGMVEERYDAYRLDGQFDMGVKRRFRETVELKIRRSVEEGFVLGQGLVGPLEVWRKWSPADHLVDPSAQELWVDVAKVVFKRRFTLDGDEILLSEEGRSQTGAGCDVEVAAIRANDLESWSFAFAAFGPTTNRHAALIAAWRALLADSPPPDEFGASFGRSSGYPEWLAHQFSRSGDLSAR